MPELAEVRLMSDYINGNVLGWNVKDIIMPTTHKGVNPKSGFDREFFDDGQYKLMFCDTRGKELCLIFQLQQPDPVVNPEPLQLHFTLGMTGNFHIHELDDNAYPKHAHLNFILQDEDDVKVLSFVDIRRFGKWKWKAAWSSNRGPDILSEPRRFIDHMYKLQQHKHRSRSLHTILMDQFWFNGIGNYLRAEICHALDVNPFEPIENYISTPEQIAQLYGIIDNIVSLAYEEGGAKLATFKNPDLSGDEPSMQKSLRCYKQPGMVCISKDHTGRAFWFHPKWEDDALQKYDLQLFRFS